MTDVDPLGRGPTRVGIGQAEQEVLGGEVVVTQVGPHRVGIIDDPVGLAAEPGLGPVGLGHGGQGLLGLGPQLGRLTLDLGQQGQDHALRIGPAGPGGGDRG